MTLSIIIPTYNEEQNIVALLRFLKKHMDQHVSEMIVVDGGSIDNTLEYAKQEGVIAVRCPEKGRASQMNFGAIIAKGDTLYFIHADTYPPISFISDIEKALNKGYDLGRYQTKFLSAKPILRINEWFTRFDLFICMGGDQTLFVRKKVFDALGGFNKDMLIMEEYEFCKRARDAANKYKIMKGAALISARKYEKNSWWQVQLANYKVVQLYKKGVDQKVLISEYKKRLQF